MSWKIDNVSYAEGTFGFTLLDTSYNQVYRRNPSYENGSGILYVPGKLGRIAFDTNTNDGLHILIDVKYNGVDEKFFSKNVRSDSRSHWLGRLYLDGDMNGPKNLAGAANCQKSCDFQRVN